MRVLAGLAVRVPVVLPLGVLGVRGVLVAVLVGVALLAVGGSPPWSWPEAPWFSSVVRVAASTVFFTPAWATALSTAGWSFLR